MAKQEHGKELQQLEEYILSTSNEDAKRHLLYPIFKKLFPQKFKIESDTNGADVYVEGQLIVEAKTDESQWLDGFYQALHYHKKFGLTYNTIIVVAHKFIGIWKLNKLPEYATLLAHTSNANTAPNAVGKDNARKTSKAHKAEIIDAAFYWLDSKRLGGGTLFQESTKMYLETYEILKILKNLESDRLQINQHNFINTIERMKLFFDLPIDAVHAFYTIVAFWDITSTIAEKESGELHVIGFKGNKMSDAIHVSPKHKKDFTKFIESQYIFTNEGSGLTVDYYFSRFDEVLAKIDPEYVKQHGIFFTDANLSKFALWFAKYHFPGNINDDYIVFDPAGGSGNLVSSWRGRIKHKIISELQPDLLRTIERRMKADPYHIDTGFTIVPKTIENKGLNFLDRPAAEYFDELKKAVKASTNMVIDKPIAFLLNPPYKNTDEKQEKREQTEAHYNIDKSILELTGEDAGKERYLAFLGQILNISKVQNETKGELPVVMIFTPTSWLIPRPTYQGFRKIWDKHFEFHSGFIVTSNEFFKLDGKWPLAFTLWQYKPNEAGNNNQVKLHDLTESNRETLNINWFEEDEKIDKQLNKLLAKTKVVTLDNSKGYIKEVVGQKMYDFKRDATKKEIDSKTTYGGLPLKDERRKNKKTYGISASPFIGFMDDATPVRVKGENDIRFSVIPDKVWFRLDTVFTNLNQTKVFCGPSDNRSYCAYDLPSAKATFSWFAITKALNGVYPVWANQYDIWAPNIPKKLEAAWYSLCFAFVLAENRCVVTKFEANNPVEGAPEVFVDNPLSTNNRNSFWCTTLQPFLDAAKEKETIAFDLVSAVTKLYKYWNTEYTKGQIIEHVGLHDEPYFKYFDYPDFLTPNSGLIQIRKYATQEGDAELLNMFEDIKKLTSAVKQELHRMLVEDFKYFG